MGMTKLDLENSDKNYLLVPLKLCSGAELKYELDIESVLEMTGKKKNLTVANS